MREEVYIRYKRRMYIPFYVAACVQRAATFCVPTTDCKDMLPQPGRKPHCYSSAWALRDNGPDSESTQVRHSITIHSWEARRRPRAHFAELLVGLLVAADGRQPNDRALPLCDTSGVGVIVASGSAAVYAWISKFAPSPTLRFPQARIVQ